MTNRRKFIGKACLAGTCLCGFSGIIKGIAQEGDTTAPDPTVSLMQDWISTLLFSIGASENDEKCRETLKQCASAHYEHLGMDNLIKPYEGQLEKFIAFISEKWGWKVDYQEGQKTLIADENKNYCVCPVVNQEKGVKSAILCYCSEGFAEMMFSKVTGHLVRAKVIASVLRGNPTCKYQIRLN